MSQVFGADSVNNTGTITLGINTETTAITGNFVSPPFQNAKAVIVASVQIGTGAGTTSISIRVRRNPNAENVIVLALGSINIAAAVVAPYCFSVSDAPIGPGPVQYAVTVQTTGASGTGTIYNANISTFLISG